MSDLRDLRAGTYDNINAAGKQQPYQVRETITAHERAQIGADVRAEPLPGDADVLPEGLLRPRMGPLSPTRGRHHDRVFSTRYPAQSGGSR